MTNKTKFLIFILAFFALVVIGLEIFLAKKPQPINQPSLTPTVSATSTPTPLPPQLEQEKIAQENYAKERSQFLESKPWVLKLPLKSNNYFISYSIDRGGFLATIYYNLNSSLSKEQQLATAKQDATNAIKNIGADLNIEKVFFTETLKK